MLIEFELKGSRTVHKGVFETTGFWARYDAHVEVDAPEQHKPDGYKIFSHFSFAYYHEDEKIAKEVYWGLLSALQGVDWKHKDIGYIREIEYAISRT